MSNALERYREAQALLNHGCSDGYCVIERTRGMHTNGGCGCLYHPDRQTLNRVGHLLRCAQEMAEELERLRALNHCCVCGGEVDTREVDEGGDPEGCQLTDGRWVCSRECCYDELDEIDRLRRAQTKEKSDG